MDIKFKGKRVDNGELVEGDLIHGVGGKAGRLYILLLVVNLAGLPGCHPLDGYEVVQGSVEVQFPDKASLVHVMNNSLVAHEANKPF